MVDYGSKWWIFMNFHGYFHCIPLPCLMMFSSPEAKSMSLQEFMIFGMGETILSHVRGCFVFTCLKAFAT